MAVRNVHVGTALAVVAIAYTSYSASGPMHMAVDTAACTPGQAVDFSV